MDTRIEHRIVRRPIKQPYQPISSVTVDRNRLMRGLMVAVPISLALWAAILLLILHACGTV